MAAISLPSNLESLPPREKAQVYNDLVSKGFSETQIRNAVESKLGAQSNGDWGALKDLASIVKTTGQAGQGGAFTTNFGDKGSWQFGQGAEYNEKNMIESSGAYFQRGDDVIVSDELFWNPDSPIGEKLAEKIDKTQSADKRAGVVITPYAVFQGKATNQQLLDEVKRSGADFVAIDPYIGFGVSEDQLLAWTREFVPQLNSLGVGVKLVLQDFSKTGQEAQTNAYNQKLLQTPGISEFISFGLEDAKDLQGSPDWTTMTGGQQFQSSGAGVPPQSTTLPNASGLMATTNLGTERDLGGTAVSNVPGRTLNAPTAQELQNTLANISSTASQEAMKSYGPNTLENALTTAIVGAITGGLLGPAGLGLTQPVAAGIGGAAGTAATGADRNQILLGALLAGGASYGLENLLGAGVPIGSQQAVELAIADDIAQLAQQGLSQNQIANIISQGYGVDLFSATEAVNSALSSVAPSAATQTVNVAGTGLLSPAIVPSTAAALSTLAGTTAPGQSVTVQGQNLPQNQVTTQDLLAALAPGLTATLPTVTGGTTQSVEVPGTKTTSTENIISSLVPALTTATIPGAAQAVTQPTGTQQVEVTTQRDQPLLPNIVPPVIAAIPALPPALTTELPKPTQPTQKADEKSLFSPSDILKLIGLLGGAGAGAALSQAGTGTVSTPPSDMMLGTTTPQFGPDYYAAVQRYYNAYMPETPRNVATPLQQWYENKFGA